jgi:hypothetical protein
VNEIAASLAASYAESASSLKLVTTKGDIDFVVARDLTGAPAMTELIGGIPTPAHTNAEILAKKIECRGAGFTHRDMFDLAALIDLDPDSVDTALNACSPESVERALSRIDDEIDALHRTLGGYVNLSPRGKIYVARASGLLDGRFGDRLAEIRVRKTRTRD